MVAVVKSMAGCCYIRGVVETSVAVRCVQCTEMEIAVDVVMLCATVVVIGRCKEG
jgi:hypothetical protein